MHLMSFSQTIKRYILVDPNTSKFYTDQNFSEINTHWTNRIDHARTFLSKQQAQDFNKDKLYGHCEVATLEATYHVKY